MSGPQDSPELGRVNQEEQNDPTPEEPINANTRTHEQDTNVDNNDDVRSIDSAALEDLWTAIENGNFDVEFKMSAPSGAHEFEQHFGQGSWPQDVDNDQGIVMTTTMTLQDANNAGSYAGHGMRNDIGNGNTSGRHTGTLMFTDGDASHFSPDPNAREVLDLSRYTYLLERYLEQHGRATSLPIQWPYGFRVFRYIRPNTTRYTDLYVYGHPEQRRWRSLDRFFVHVEWLLERAQPRTCQCVCCRPGARRTN